ncbi:hypothetical protein, partial [Nonomuraea lactucae]|uniref:hypothetical protein n=1 Tax=Nonomuraea lactucae TaxID=2249762 RepID=UPI0019644639
MDSLFTAGRRGPLGAVHGTFAVLLATALIASARDGRIALVVGGLLLGALYAAGAAKVVGGAAGTTEATGGRAA